MIGAAVAANTRRCHKWEQGEIPEAHARFLGLRDGVEAFSAAKNKKKEAEASGQAVERSLFTATAGGASLSLRGGEEESGEEGQQGQGDRFITYWSEKGTDRPVRWVFFNDAYFEVRVKANAQRGRIGSAVFLRCHRVCLSVNSGP